MGGRNTIRWLPDNECSGICPIEAGPAPSDNGVASNSSSRQSGPPSMSLSWTSYVLNEPAAACDARLSERIPVRCGAQLSFETEAGRSRTIKGRVLNMSTSGVLLETLRPISIGSHVRIRANELLVGAAYVRHSNRRSWRFRIGLEFTMPVRNRY